MEGGNASLHYLAGADWLFQRPSVYIPERRRWIGSRGKPFEATIQGKDDRRDDDVHRGLLFMEDSLDLHIGLCAF